MKPMKFVSTWAPADVERLLALQAEGKTLREIGVALGKSRTAVAGKLLRLREVNAAPPARPREAPAPRPRAEPGIPAEGVLADNPRHRCTYLDGHQPRGFTHRMPRCPYVCTAAPQSGRRVSWCEYHAALVYANWGQW